MSGPLGVGTRSHYHSLEDMRQRDESNEQFDPRERARQKALRREADNRALMEGGKSAHELRREVNWFSNLKFVIDWEHAKRLR